LVVGRSDSTYVSSDGEKVNTVDAGVFVAVAVRVGVALDGMVAVLVAVFVTIIVEVRVGVAALLAVAVGVLVDVGVAGAVVLVGGGAELDKVWIISWGPFAAASRLLKFMIEVLVVLTPKS